MLSRIILKNVQSRPWATTFDLLEENKWNLLENMKKNNQFSEKIKSNCGSQEGDIS